MPPTPARICPACRAPTDARLCPHDGVLTLPREALEADAPRDLIGSIFDGRYRVEALLGLGGMGAVYRATQLSVKRPVALKLIADEMISGSAHARRFRQEAEVVARLNHPHIVQLHDFGATEEGMLYLVMELVDGESLSHLIRAERPIGSRRAIHLASQVLSALAAAHDAGVVHRDLKPDNIMRTTALGDPDTVKVLDFGIAWVEEEEGAARERMTRTGLAVGTPRYMAPEQAMDTPITGQQDLYALGVILYELLAGRHPFACNTSLQYVAAHQHALVPALDLSDVELGPRLAEWVLGLLRKHPDARPQGARMALAQLEAIRDGRPDPSPSRDVPAAYAATESRVFQAGAPASFATGEPSVEVASSRRERGAGPSPSAVPPTRPLPRRRGLPALVAGLALAGAAWVLWPPGPPQVMPALQEAPALSPVEMSRPRELGLEVPNAELVDEAGAVEPPGVAAPLHPEAPAQRTVLLTSSPPGAAVWRGDRSMGHTPLELPWPEGAAPPRVELRAAGHRTSVLGLGRPHLDSGTAHVDLLPLPKAAAPAPGRRPPKASTPAAGDYRVVP